MEVTGTARGELFKIELYTIGQRGMLRRSSACRRTDAGRPKAQGSGQKRLEAESEKGHIRRVGRSHISDDGGRGPYYPYKQKAIIFRQGATCDAVFYIVKGTVDLSVVSAQGKERVVGQLAAGAFIAEGCLAGHPRNLASARASSEATVARIEVKTFAEALNAHSDLSRRFMEYLLMRNSQVEADLVDHLFNSSEKRLARLLLILAQIGKEGELRTVSAPISQEIMAARVGTTRPRINQFLNKFRKLGLIEYNGDLKVHSSLMNVIVRE